MFCLLTYLLTYFLKCCLKPYYVSEVRLALHINLLLEPHQTGTISTVNILHPTNVCTVTTSAAWHWHQIYVVNQVDYMNKYERQTVCKYVYVDHANTELILTSVDHSTPTITKLEPSVLFADFNLKRVVFTDEWSKSCQTLTATAADTNQ